MENGIKELKENAWGLKKSGQKGWMRFVDRKF